MVKYPRFDFLAIYPPECQLWSQFSLIHLKQAQKSLGNSDQIFCQLNSSYLANWCHVLPKNLLMPKPSDAMEINILPLQNALALPQSILPLLSISCHQKQRNLYCFQAQNHHQNHGNTSWRVRTQEVPKEINFTSKITGRLPSRIVEHYLTGSRWVSYILEVVKTQPKLGQEAAKLAADGYEWCVSTWPWWPWILWSALESCDLPFEGTHNIELERLNLEVDFESADSDEDEDNTKFMVNIG